MKSSSPTTRRRWLTVLGQAVVGLVAVKAARPVKAAVQNALATAPAPKSYDPFAHSWRMCIDVEKCIGCGLCVEACKKENHVIPKAAYFRTWIERYIIKRGEPGSEDPRGETIVDSPNGGHDGFPPSTIPREEVLKSFFVPKLCNQCENSPCDQACPVGATFRTPDGAVIIDKTYCIGCGFCIQACPYGCRYLDPNTHMADKCTLCYHRLSRGLKTACVEVCPTGARILGDMKDSRPDNPIRQFVEKNKVQVIKPHLGTEPRVLYAGLDKEVR